MTDEEISARTKSLGDAFVKAMNMAIAEAGSQKKLSEKTGIHQSRISDYSNGNYDFSKLTIGTLIQIFPKLEINYLSEINVANSPEVLEIIEHRMISLFRKLTTQNKLLCYENMVKTYGETFEETREQKGEEKLKEETNR